MFIINSDGTTTLTTEEINILNCYAAHFENETAAHNRLTHNLPYGDTACAAHFAALFSTTYIAQHTGQLFTLFYRHNKRAYTAEELSYSAHRPIFSTDLFPGGYNSYIIVHQIPKGYTLFFEKPLKNAEQYTRLPQIEQALSLSPKHHTQVYQHNETQALYIFTTHWNLALFVKTISLIGLTSPVAQTAAQNPAFRNILENLYNLNLQPAVAAAPDLIAKLNAEREHKAFKVFKQLATTPSQAYIKQIHDNIATVAANAEYYFKELIKAEEKKRQLNTELTAYTTNSSELDPAFEVFLQQNKHIKLIRCTQDASYFLFTTPLINYDPEEIKQYTRNNTNTFYSHGPEYAQALFAIFGKQSYHLLTKTALSIPWIEPDIRYFNHIDETPSYANPHIRYYNCFASSRAEALKAKINLDYIRMLNILLACCANINFNDYAVVNKLINDLWNTRQKPFFYKPEDPDTLISLNTIMEKLAHETNHT